MRGRKCREGRGFRHQRRRLDGADTRRVATQRGAVTRVCEHVGVPERELGLGEELLEKVFCGDELRAKQELQIRGLRRRAVEAVEGHGGCADHVVDGVPREQVRKAVCVKKRRDGVDDIVGELETHRVAGVGVHVGDVPHDGVEQDADHADVELPGDAVLAEEAVGLLVGGLAGEQVAVPVVAGTGVDVVVEVLDGLVPLEADRHARIGHMHNPLQLDDQVDLVGEVRVERIGHIRHGHVGVPDPGQRTRAAQFQSDLRGGRVDAPPQDLRERPLLRREPLEIAVQPERGGQLRRQPEQHPCRVTVVRHVVIVGHEQQRDSQHAVARP